jgi:hypothetical protein
MACRGCGHPNPRKHEENNPNSLFCNKQCQKSFYRIGLKDDGRESGLEPIDDDDTIGVQSADGKYFRLKRSDAIKMRTIRYLVEDSGTNDYIPIPTVHSNIFSLIIPFLQGDNVSLMDMTKQPDSVRYDLALAIAYLDVAYMFYYMHMVDFFARKILQLSDYREDENQEERFNRDKYIVPIREFLLPIATILSPTHRMIFIKKLPKRYDNISIQTISKYRHLCTMAFVLIAGSKDLLFLLYNDAFGQKNHNKIIKKDKTAKTLNDNNNEPFRTAVGIGNISVVKSLLKLPKEYEIDPAVNDNEPIRMAAANGNVQMVKLLLETHNRGINGSANDDEIIRDAVKRRDTSMIELLLSNSEYGIDAYSGFDEACQNNYETQGDIIRLIVGLCSKNNLKFDYEAAAEIASGDDDGVLEKYIDDMNPQNSKKQFDREYDEFDDKMKSFILKGNLTQLNLILQNYIDDGYYEVDFEKYIAFANDYNRDNVVQFLIREKDKINK